MKKLIHTLKLLNFLIVFLLSFTINGQNFQVVVQNNPAIHFLRCVNFPNPAIGYAVGDSGTIVKTIDSGNTWLSQASSTNYRFYSVRFVNANFGWAVGDTGTIRKTTNGGLTWINQNYGSDNYRSVYFLNPDTGFIAGYNCTLLKTTNGGNNWNTIALSSSGNLLSVYFKSVDTGYVGGLFDTLLMTTNCGNSWTKTRFGGYSHYLTFFDFPSSNIGYALTELYSYNSTNGGISWAYQNNNLGSYPGFYAKSTSYTFPDTGYIVGYNLVNPYPFGGSVILKTTNGGNHWDSLNNIASGKFLMSVVFTNANNGYIVGGNVDNNGYSDGRNGIILKTKSSALGVENNRTSNKNKLVTYPNPASNELIIEISDKNKEHSFEIINSMGQIIYKSKFSERAIVNTSNFKSGIYIIKIENDRLFENKKIIIE